MEKILKAKIGPNNPSSPACDIFIFHSPFHVKTKRANCFWKRSVQTHPRSQTLFTSSNMKGGKCPSVSIHAIKKRHRRTEGTFWRAGGKDEGEECEERERRKGDKKKENLENEWWLEDKELGRTWASTKKIGTGRRRWSQSRSSLKRSRLVEKKGK